MQAIPLGAFSVSNPRIESVSPIGILYGRSTLLTVIGNNYGADRACVDSRQLRWLVCPQERRRLCLESARALASPLATGRWLWKPTSARNV